MFRFQQFQDHSSFKRTRKRSSISNKSKISVKESDKIRRGSRIAEIFRSDKHILNDSKDKDNSNLDSKAIDQVYDMIDHAKKEQSQLLTNIGLPTTKRKIKFFKTKIQKFEKCAIYDEQNQLIKMASNPLAATQIFNSTYDELKSKRDFRNKVLENSRALKGLKSMKSKMKNDLELLYKHTFNKTTDQVKKEPDSALLNSASSHSASPIKPSPSIPKISNAMTPFSPSNFISKRNTF